MKINTLKKFILIIFSAFISYPSLAEEKGAEPPQEMVDACKETQINEKCSYNDQAGKKISGSCIKDGRVIICYPEETKKEPHH